ncbi:MAG: hypothetical protein KZQ61_16530 [Candidatus Thiodiazotropha sp. (ex Lucinoma aequizonata)]|nr:hypothetical protein [Candidatus Thiodiazotropha sp. (ex Lucinoma aequizonata)]
MLERQGGTLIPLHCGSYVYIRSFTNVRSKLRGIELQGIQLPYYPPYHNKYNPMERLWSVLENH